jgi:hypothetical protein
MIKNHISGILLQKLGLEPTSDQKKLIEALAGFVAEFTDPKTIPTRYLLLKDMQEP